MKPKSFGAPLMFPGAPLWLLLKYSVLTPMWWMAVIFWKDMHGLQRMNCLVLFGKHKHATDGQYSTHMPTRHHVTLMIVNMLARWCIEQRNLMRKEISVHTVTRDSNTLLRLFERDTRQTIKLLPDAVHCTHPSRFTERLPGSNLTYYTCCIVYTVSPAAQGIITDISDSLFFGFNSW